MRECYVIVKFNEDNSISFTDIVFELDEFQDMANFISYYKNQQYEYKAIRIVI